LDEESNVQKMHITSADRPVTFYNLEVIISVGYRVNSIKGARFRQWATQVLRQYLVLGYALNEKRLRESQRQLADLKRLVQLQAEVAASQELAADYLPKLWWAGHVPQRGGKGGQPTLFRG
jgi:hypothetical protein